MKKNIKSQLGVTLMELLVAITVIAIALLALILAIIYGIKVNHQAKNLAISYQIANKEVETIRTIPFANLADQTEGNFYSDSTADLAKLSDGHGLLTIENYNGDVHIKEITVKVNWTDGQSAKSTVFKTLVAEGGLNQ